MVLVLTFLLFDLKPVAVLHVNTVICRLKVKNLLPQLQKVIWHVA